MTKQAKKFPKTNLFGIKITRDAYHMEEKRAYRALRVPSSEGLGQELFIPRTDVYEPRKLKDFLIDQEFDLPDDNEVLKQLLADLAKVKPRVRCLLTGRLGWFKDTYVFPFESIGPDGSDPVVFRGSAGYRREEATRGTLKGWRRRMARLAETSSLAIFATSGAFAPMLLRFAPSCESGIFHIYGLSGTGKTTVVAAAASVWRGGRAALDTWNTTQSALQELFAKRNDGLICLDEITLLASDKRALRSLVQQAAHLTTQGKGRQRSVLAVGDTDPDPYRFLGLSTGEKAAAAIASEAGEKRMKGEEARFIDIPVPSEETGVFDRLDTDESGDATLNSGEIARALNEAVKECYGIPAPAFARYLVEDMERAQAKVTEYMEIFRRRVQEKMRIGSDGWEQRILTKFALVYAAGRIARDAGLVPWEPALIGSSIYRVYRWARAELKTDQERVADTLLQLQGWAHGDGLVDLVEPKKPATVQEVLDANVLRYRKRKGDQVQLLVPVEKLKSLDDSGSCDLLLDRLETDRVLLRTGHSNPKRVRQIVPLKGMKRGPYYYTCTEDLVRYELPFLRGREDA